MILAKEARELASKSEQEVDDYIRVNFEVQVQKAAREGKRKYFHPVGSLPEGTSIPVFAQDLHKVIEKLKYLGYTTSVTKSDDVYIHQDFMGIGLIFRNYGVLVTW